MLRWASDALAGAAPPMEDDGSAGVWRLAILTIGESHHETKYTQVQKLVTQSLDANSVHHGVLVTIFLCTATPWNVSSRHRNVTYVSVNDIIKLPGSKHVLNQFDRAHNCYLNAQAHEQSSGHTFTHLVRTRPDLEYLPSNTPQLDLRWHSDHVAAKAREVVYRRPTNVSTKILAFHDCFFLQTKRLDILDAHATRQRAAMDKWNVPLTALLDDQFALVPRKYADAYFLTAKFNASKSHDMPDHTFTRHSLDVGGRRAAKEVYGGSAGPHQLMWVYFERSFVGVYNQYNGIDVGSGHTHLCCERLITWRVVGRMVPFRLTPFMLGLPKFAAEWNRQRHIDITC